MKYRAEIDGLRALAVIPVILFHAGFERFSGGFVGVDVFFVISGYLITTIIWSELETNNFSIINFYERRARRILPALFLVMLTCLPFAWLWLLPGDMKSFSQALLAVSLFVSNVLFWKTSGYFAPTAELNPLLHTWSLAVEEQYYVFFPIFLMVTWRFGIRWVLGILIAVFFVSLAAAHWMVFLKPNMAFYLLPTRGWELLVGAFVAIYLIKVGPIRSAQIKNVGGVLGLAMILYAIFAFSEKTPFPSLYALVPTIGTALIILCASTNTIVGKVLGLKALVGVGLISYSAYLWHQPLFAFAKHRTFEDPSRSAMLFLVLASLLLAYLSWKFVEQPFRDRHRFSRNLVFVQGFAFSLVFIVIGLAGHFSGGYSFRVSDRINTVISAYDVHAKLRDGDNCNIAARNYSIPACIKGDPNSATKVALLGDSHSSALLPKLDEFLARQELALVQYTKNGCPIGKDLITTPNGNCDLFLKQVYADLERKKVDTVIIASRWIYYVSGGSFDGQAPDLVAPGPAIISVKGVPFSAALEIRKKAVLASFVGSMREFLSRGMKVVLIYPIPEQEWNIPTKMAKYYFHDLPLDPNKAVSTQLFRKRNADIYKTFDGLGEDENLRRVYPERTLCNTYQENRCAAWHNDTPLYFDDDHLTVDGAEPIVKDVMKALTELISVRQ